jgi:tRNA A37 threonylcarbamoyladenosine dehydratase
MNDGRFARIELMLGKDACKRLTESFVTVIGLGAVGSYAVEGLARAGIGRLRLVDFDVVSLSNINRQLYALGSTVGRPKIEVARERILDINPSCQVETIRAFVDGQTVIDFLAGPPDLVIDAIDALLPKVELLAAARKSEIPLISCLGAALRSDPALVRIAPLHEVHHCRLGSTVRQRLRRRDVPVDFPCVFSEEPVPYPLPVAAPTDALGEQPITDRGRPRNILGSLPTITGIFGLTAANLAIKMLACKEKPVNRG